MSDSLPVKSQHTGALRPDEFSLIRDIIYRKIGVNLEGKEILVTSRISKAMRDLGVTSFEQYYARLRLDPSGQAMTTMVDALVTNHTSFFRENQHFDYLKRVILPELGSRTAIRIWSAACSSGEEPYSIAITLIDALRPPEIAKVQILATDISLRVLNTARRGLYPVSRLGSLPSERLRPYMLKGFGVSEGEYMMKKEVRALIEFQQINLMEDFSRLGTFSVIFCRNVMIYFDQATQQRLVNCLAARLEPGGYLLIGHSESLNGINHPLSYLCPATYRKAPIAHRSQKVRSIR